MDQLIRAISERVHPLRTKLDLRPLVDQISTAQIVMLGEATHGTQEFYEWRRLISEWLIVKHGFRLIAVEGEWPSCHEVNSYIHGKEGSSAHEALAHFNRWPTWMWANREIVRLVEWMRSHNGTVSDDRKVGFYGLDVYSLFDSIDAVLKQLTKINPFLARRARVRYGCFDQFRRDELAYAKSLMHYPEGCEDEVIESLEELLSLRLDGAGEAREHLLDAQQNARIIANAEDYYRTMMRGDEASWNVRDRHMLETLSTLVDHFGARTKVIVWAHNTHIGDYRATDMAAQGQINIGGLARQKWGDENVALVGFGTDHGDVVASHAWDGPTEIMPVAPGMNESYDHALHSASVLTGAGAYSLNLRSKGAREGPLAEIRGQRAIGVVYQPAFESFAGYVPTSLARRYDAFLFFDETSPIEPLDVPFRHDEIPEAWPRGQ